MQNLPYLKIWRKEGMKRRYFCHREICFGEYLSEFLVCPILRLNELIKMHLAI